MDWVKLHTGYFDDELIESLDDATEVMFVRGLARAGKLEREGFIPESSLPKLTRRRRHEPLVSELVEKGLWKRVPGGVQVTNWDRWQDSLDELARRRAVDRERQRKRRLRLRDQAESTMSRDNGHPSRDVTPPEGEGELEGVHLGGLGTAPQANGAEPPRRCSRHLNDHDPPPCGPCRDARLAAEAWQREHAKTLAAASAAAAKQRATTRRCPRCGTKHTGPCTQ